ncbi:MAG: asparaginase, partial [Stellaceae bacterium]
MQSTMTEAPILVESTRGGMVESRHRGIAAVSDAAGNIVLAWGEAMRPIYPRS